ncbi:hypothetical protein [Halorhabdus rudnickae]|uniref:hypothetical protein n=1 Tax=Halorhabdus rudnickae TaxID=1775544 RepID=UPI001082C396|nr:hypothetical protein [Halorhabdus rudnickae]
MVLDFEVRTQDALWAELRRGLDRALALKTWITDADDGVVSEAFVRRHTRFESVTAFCEACPCESNTIGGVQRLAAGERDAFVDRTTDFETWPAMKESAAVEDMVTLHNV